MLNRLEDIKDSLYKYLETKLELFKTELQDGLETTIIKLLYLVVLLILIFVTAVFLLILLAVFLNLWLKSNYAGFVVVSVLMTLSTLAWVVFGLQLQALIRRGLRLFFKA